MVLIEVQINTQLIPPSDPLIANMPLGRDIHAAKSFVLQTLDDDTLTRMRAPPDLNDVDDDNKSSSDEGEKSQSGLPRSFPGSSSAATQEDSYY